MTDLILRNGRITTLDPKTPETTALLIKDGQIASVDTDREIMAHAETATQVIDLHGRRVIPGLNDSHTHLIRGGLSYNIELRWENVPSVADALAMLRRQAANTPAPQWVRVVGGVVGIPVRRTPHADAAGNQRRCTGYPGLRAASLFPGTSEPGGPAGAGDHPRYAQPAGGRNRA